jgi:cyanophycinase-like exopeptidase
VGVGIDEGTAVVVRGARLEVVGVSSALIVDARGASVPGAAPGAVHAGTGLALHVLRAGMTFDLR